jgi:hypothetical protein
LRSPVSGSLMAISDRRSSSAARAASSRRRKRRMIAAKLASSARPAPNATVIARVARAPLARTEALCASAVAWAASAWRETMSSRTPKTGSMTSWS